MADKRVQVWVGGARQIVDETARAEWVALLRARTEKIALILVADAGGQGEGQGIGEALGGQAAAALAAAVRDATAVLADTLSEGARVVWLDEVAHSRPDAGLSRGESGMLNVDGEKLRQLLARGALPVLAPLILDQDGAARSVDAAVVATQVALALGAHKLVFLGNLPGIKIAGRTMRALSLGQVDGLINDGYLAGQELAAALSAVSAVKAGVSQVLITDLAGLAKDGGTAIVNG